MKQVRFEFEELPFKTLSQFGLTQEMIEDLPMQSLEDISHGRHSPVLPIKITDENGNIIDERSRFSLVRKENGEADVIFYPVLKKSPLEQYTGQQQKQLELGKAILADIVSADGRNTKVFVQIDRETKQVMSVPTQVIARNLQVLADELKLSSAEIKVMQQGEPLTFVIEDEPVTVGIDLNEKNGIRFSQGDSQRWMEHTKREWDKYTMVAGLWMMTEISIMSLRSNTQKSCGMSRKRVLSATWEPVYISKI